MVKGFSLTQIALHWIMAVLIVFQLLFADSIKPAWHAVRNGTTPTISTMAWAHIIGGILVLALVLWRLWLRQSRGVPDFPEGESDMMKLAAAAGHWGLYAIMVGASVTGLIAWYGAIPAMGEVHQLFQPLFYLLIGVHVAAALYHHFILKDGLLNRMRQPQD